MNLNLAKYLDRYVGILLCYGLAALDLFREMLFPREGSIRVRRILIVKLWGIGNIIMLLPILKMIRRRYPDATIHMLTLTGNREILEGNPYLDRLWTLEDRGFLRFAFSFVRAVAGLRRARIDLFLDFEQFARTSTLLGFFIGAPQRVGLHTPGQGRYLLYTAPVRYRDDQHMSRTFLDIARSAGVAEERYVPVPPVIGFKEEAAVDRALLGVDRRLVAFHVGSGDNFLGRRWLPVFFARAADELVRRHGICPVFTGTEAESSLVAGVISRMEEADRALDLSGQLRIRELGALLLRVELLISNDTGPVHLASSLGRPVLGLYGPNTPVLYGPLSAGSVSFYKNLPCSPCITNMNYKTSFCRLPVCMGNITVGEVCQAAAGILNGGGAEGGR